MQNTDPRPKIGGQVRQLGVLPKIFAILGGAVVLAAAVAFSIIVLAVLVSGAVLIGAYFWWRTRSLRKQMRETQPRHEGNVIEGEVIRREGSDHR